LGGRVENDQFSQINYHNRMFGYMPVGAAVNEKLLCCYCQLLNCNFIIHSSFMNSINISQQNYYGLVLEELWADTNKRIIRQTDNMSIPTFRTQIGIFGTKSCVTFFGITLNKRPFI